MKHSHGQSDSDIHHYSSLSVAVIGITIAPAIHTTAVTTVATVPGILSPVFRDAVELQVGLVSPILPWLRASGVWGVGLRA